MKSDSFWFDEVISAEISKVSLADSFQYLRYENNPPLHYWFLHFWGRIFGFGEVPARSLSLVFNLITLFPVYFLGKKLFNRRVAAIATGIFFLNPFVIFLSMQARMYSQLFLFFSLSSFFFWRLFKGDTQKIILIGYFLATLAAVYSHLTAIFLLLTQGLFIILYRKQSKNSTRILWVLSTVCILFLPWLINFAADKIYLLNKGILRSGWYFDSNRYFAYPVVVAAPMVFLTNSLFEFLIPQTNLVAVLVGVSLLFFAMFKVERISGINLSGEKQLVFKTNFNQPVVVFSLISFLIPLLISVFSYNVLAFRYYTLSALFFYLLLAKGVNELLQLFRDFFVSKRNLISLVIIVVFLIGARLAYTTIYDYHNYTPRGFWKGAVNYIEKSNADRVLVPFSGWAVTPYYKNGLPPVSYYFFPKNIEMEERKNMLQYVTRYNWLNPSLEDFKYVKDQINNTISPKDKKIIYIDIDSNLATFMKSVLQEQGFNCTNVFDETIWDQFFAITLERDSKDNINPKCFPFK